MTIDLETLEVDRVDHWNFEGKTNQLDRQGFAARLDEYQQADFLRFTDGLNEDQLVAFVGITTTKDRLVTLSGSGGTGKTFTLIRILKHFLSLQYSVAGIAPTHKACNVMRSMGAELGSDVEFCTLSAALRLKPGRNEVGNKQTQSNSRSKRAQIHEFDVVWIDECSQVKQSELKLILANPAQKLIIFTGDEKQMSPYGELSSPVFRMVMEWYRLTKIERYGGVLADYVQSVREDMQSDKLPVLNTAYDTTSKDTGIVKYTDSDAWMNVIKSAFGSDAYKKNPDHCKAIAYRNARVNVLNIFIRNVIHPGVTDRFVEGDKLVTKSPIFTFDQFGEVNQFPAFNTQEELFVFSATIGESIVDNLTIKHWIIEVSSDSRFNAHTLTPVHADSEKDLSEWLLATRLDLKDGSCKKWSWKGFDEVLQKYLIDDKEVRNKKGQVIGITYESVLSYAFAITAFSAQGSTYSNVFVDLKDIDVLLKVGTDTLTEKREKRNKAAYVALTRASKRVFALV